MSILKILSSDNYISVNKTLIQKVGLEAAAILGELASEFCYWEEHDGLADGYFFSTVENIEEKTGLSAYNQRQAMNKLMELGLIDVKKMGIPAKRYIRINEEQVAEVFNNKLLKNLTTSNQIFSQQEGEFFNTNNNINNNNISNKNIEKNNIFDDILDSVPVIANNDDLRETFTDFIKMRKTLKKPLTDRGLKLTINNTFKLGGGDPDVMKAVLEQSIANSWIGVFPLKNVERIGGMEKSKQKSYNPFTELKRQEGLI